MLSKRKNDRKKQHDQGPHGAADQSPVNGCPWSDMNDGAYLLEGCGTSRSVEDATEDPVRAHGCGMAHIQSNLSRITSQLPQHW